MTDVAVEATQMLRDDGLPVEMDHLGRSLKAQFKHADRLGRPVRRGHRSG